MGYPSFHLGSNHFANALRHWKFDLIYRLPLKLQHLQNLIFVAVGKQAIQIRHIYLLSRVDHALHMTKLLRNPRNGPCIKLEHVP